jgi:hypothetical protein
MAIRRIFPSRKWYPQNLADQVLWWANFATQFAAIGLGLGFTAGEIAAVQDDNSVMQFLAQTREAVEAYVKAIRQYTNDIRELPIGEPTPAFPADPSFTLPNVVATGINQRLDELVDRVLAAPGYTNEIGALLGIIPTGPTGPGANTPVDELKPVIKTSQSFSDYKFTVNVTRLGQSGYKVQIQRDGGEWIDAGFATTNPLVITVTPTDPGKPERIMVRAILLNQNQPVGEPSDPTYVTVNP